MSFSVVILSKNADNLVPCVRAIQAMEPGLQPRRIIVVDDGARAQAEPQLPGITWVTGKKDFVFARNANIGIDAAAPFDVILLNDDALLETPYGFTGMWGAQRANPEYGVVASSCNTVGNPNQHHHLGYDGLRDEPRTLCFICVLIPRATIEKLGGLDELFVHYGLDDDDYCLRARSAGLKLGIWDGCFVDHGSLKSSYRGQGAGDFRANLRLFIQKYGVDNWGQTRETSQFKELFS